MGENSTNKRTQRQGMRLKRKAVPISEDPEGHLGNMGRLFLFLACKSFESKYPVVALFVRSSIMPGTKEMLSKYLLNQNSRNQ